MAETKYSVTYPERLRQLCIEKGWFSGGTNEQYEKMFFLNDENKPISVIATVIWLCSDEENISEIQKILEEEKRRYLSQQNFHCQNDKAPDSLFALRLCIKKEKNFVVKAKDLSLAKDRLTQAYNFGEIELDEEATCCDIVVYPDISEQEYIDACGTDEYDVIE